MSDLFGNHIVGFSTRRLISCVHSIVTKHDKHEEICTEFTDIFEPPRGKTNNVVSEQV